MEKGCELILDTIAAFIDTYDETLEIECGEQVETIVSRNMTVKINGRVFKVSVRAI